MSESEAWRVGEQPSPGACTSIRDYYSALAGRFDDVYTGTGAFRSPPWSGLSTQLAYITDWAKGRLAPSTSVADLGCGTGHWTRHLAASTSEVWLVDISPEMLAVAEATVRQACPLASIHQLCGDLLAPEAEFMPRSADLAVLGFLLSHYPDNTAVDLLRTAMTLSDRVLVVDSRAHVRHPSSDWVFKEHRVGDEWCAVPKRYPSMNEWRALVTAAGGRVQAPTATNHFVAFVIEG